MTELPLIDFGFLQLICYTVPPAVCRAARSTMCPFWTSTTSRETSPSVHVSSRRSPTSARSVAPTLGSLPTRLGTLTQVGLHTLAPLPHGRQPREKPTSPRLRGGCPCGSGLCFMPTLFS